MITTAYQRAFTLIETLVVIGLTAIVMTTLGFLIQYFYKTNAYTLEQTQAVNSARSSVEHTVADMRGATYGADGAYPIALASTSTVIFYANIDNDPSVEKVRYYLSGSSLLRGSTKASGNPPRYIGQPENTTLVIDNIRNDSTEPLFTYFDGTGNELVDPVNIAKIRSIRINVLTDVNPIRAPDVYSLSGEATLRNFINL